LQNAFAQVDPIDAYPEPDEPKYDPNEHQKRTIEQAIEFLCEMAKNAKDPAVAKKLEAACKNIQDYLDRDKIRVKQLGPGTMGENHGKEGDIWLSPTNFPFPRPGEAGIDLSNPTHIWFLMTLIDTLIHEKFHSENHNFWDSASGNIEHAFGGNHDAENEAWAHSLILLDEIIQQKWAECMEKIEEDAEREEIESCLKSVEQMISYKILIIGDYNLNKYGPPIGQDVIDALKRVLEETKKLISLVEVDEEEEPEEEEQEVKIIMKNSANKLNISLGQVEEELFSIFDQKISNSRKNLPVNSQKQATRIAEIVSTITDTSLSSPTKIRLELTLDKSPLSIDKAIFLIESSSGGKISVKRFDDSSDYDYTLSISQGSIVQIYSTSSPLTRAKLLYDNDVFTIQGIGTPVTSPKIPAWIKKNADWWAQGLITDRDFAAGLGYMVKEGIIKVDNVEFDSEGSVAVSDDIQIPKWIHNNAKWWVDGAITDDDFKSGIQYMVKEKVIDFEAKKETASIVPEAVRERDVLPEHTAETVGEFTVTLSEQDLEKTVTATSKIVVANEVIHGLLLESNNYEIKMLDDMVDEAWNTFGSTKDKNDMNRAVALENSFSEGNKVGAILLTELKQANRNSEEFFDSIQKAGFDKFELKSNASTETCSLDDVSKIRNEKDFDDAKKMIKDCQKVIKIANQEISIMLPTNLSLRLNAGDGADITVTTRVLSDETSISKSLKITIPADATIGDYTIPPRVVGSDDPVITPPDLYTVQDDEGNLVGTISWTETNYDPSAANGPWIVVALTDPDGVVLDLLDVRDDEGNLVGTLKILSEYDPRAKGGWEKLYIMDKENNLDIFGTLLVTSSTLTGTDDTTTPITVSVTPTSVNQGHTVGSTSCPQSLGYVTLNSNQAGTWSVTSKPSWIDVTISSNNQASISFNCNIDNLSTHTESGSISFSLNDSSNTSIGSVSVSVIMGITGQF